MINKKIWIYAAIAAIGVILIIFFQGESLVGQPEESQLKEIKIATFPSSFFNFPIYVAQEKGFLKENGLTAKFEQVIPDVAISALMAKEIDYSTYVTGATAASQKGFPVKIVMAFLDRPFSLLVSRVGTELSNFKNLGVVQRLTPQHYLTLKLIKENSMPAEIIFTGTELASNVQLSQGMVDAIMSTNPVAIFKFREEGFDIIETADDSKMIFGGLVTTDEKIENDPEEIEKVVKSWQSAVEFIRTEPEETKDLLFEYFMLERNETNERILESTYSIALEYFLDKGIPQEAAIEKLIQFIKAGEFESIEEIESQIVTQEDIEKSFDSRFLKTSDDNE